MNYFNDSSLIPNIHRIKDDEFGLREAQLGAYWAVCSHFTVSDESALVTMPTGSGKTALMTLLPFGLAAFRVLVIAPSRIVRDQDYKEFKTLRTLKKTGVFPNDVKMPRVFRVLKQMRKKTMWNEIKVNDVIIGTPQCVSPEYAKVKAPPSDYFDLVLIDEAHHSPARTWIGIIRAFPNARKILFTATPFRRDKKEIPADFVYNYPLKKALQKGILRKINFIPLEGVSKKIKDKKLCEKAKEILNADKRKGKLSKLIIRTNYVKDSEELVKLYKQRELKVESVHSGKSLRHNNKVLSEIRANKLDGIVCVGMLGEGLDIPMLNIAVMHRPHQSFPATLQFIGRVTREAPENVAKPRLIAIPSDVQGETEELYEEDAAWKDLIPQFADAAIEREKILRKFLSRFHKIEAEDLGLRGIYPSFNVQIYRVEKSHFKLKAKLRLRKHIKVITRQYVPGFNFLVIITGYYDQPVWSRELSLETIRYDLHIYYYHKKSQLLFESSTSKLIAKDIRGNLTNSNREHRYRKINEQEIMNILRNKSEVEYFQVGLRNVLGLGRAIPTYKSMAGRYVQGAVRPSDGRVFAPGHVFGRFDFNELLGISCSSSRVWSVQRSDLFEFMKWCMELANRISGTPEKLPDLAHLRYPRIIDSFPSRPIAAEFHPDIYQAEIEIVKKNNRGEEKIFKLIDFSMKVESIKDTKDKIMLYINLEQLSDEIQILYDLKSPKFFTCLSSGKNVSYSARFKLSGRPEIYSINELFENHSPMIFFGDGSAVCRNNLYPLQSSFPAVPDDCLKKAEWGNVDITNEERKAPKSKINVQQFTESYIRSIFGNSIMLIKDHGSYEIADYIAIHYSTYRDKQIHLYHCKASGEPKPGLRIDDLNELASQAIKSLRWSSHPDLFNDLLRRENLRKKYFKFIIGSRKELEELNRTSSPNEYEFFIYLVQPGLKLEKMCGKKRDISNLLLACHEWLNGQDVRMRIIGS